jgi:ADP-heptose:LPS heptosyltransferase
VVRYGGFGDMIQAASVLPHLKAAGLEVAVNCHPSGADLLRCDPHIDELIVQDRDEIDPGKLDEHWARMAGCFDRFINLTGSVERSLLAWPGDETYRTEFARERHARMNVNYLERTHDIAQVPHQFHARFYPSPGEQKWARRERLQLAGQRPLVMLSLSGSSVHKAYPHWDAVIAWLMHATSAVVITVGDIYCRILEGGWTKERRVKLRAGALSIRRTLTLAEHCDLVVGTETGVMNAVGLLPVPKVLMLSHSSVENLSKHWMNTTNLEPFMAKCHPCHKLHYTSRTCPRPAEAPNSRAAWCAWSIEPERVQAAMAAVLLEQAA